MSFANGYSACRKLTFNVRPTAALTDFPNLVLGTYAELADIAHGGVVNNTVTLLGQTVSADVIFTSDAAGTVLLSWEIESWTAATGAIVAWVKFSRSSSADDVIYMWAGKASVTTYQCTASATWADIVARYGLPNGLALSAFDSSSIHYDGILKGSTPPAPTAGKINGGGNFNGTTAYVDLGTDLGQSGELTLSAWINSTTVTLGARCILANCQSDGNAQDYSLELNRIAAKVSTTWGNTVIKTGSISVLINTWTHVAMTRSGSTGNWTVNLYVNGTSDGLAVTTVVNPNAPNVTTAIGRVGAANFFYFLGVIDEVRISSAVHTPEWIAHEYLQQSQASPWYTTEVLIPPGGGRMLVGVGA